MGYKDDLDLYAYVGNDPVNKEDSTGLGALAGTGQDKKYADQVNKLRGDHPKPATLSLGSKGTLTMAKTGQNLSLTVQTPAGKLTATGKFEDVPGRTRVNATNLKWQSHLIVGDVKSVPTTISVFSKSTGEVRYSFDKPLTVDMGLAGKVDVAAGNHVPQQ